MGKPLLTENTIIDAVKCLKGVLDCHSVDIYGPMLEPKLALHVRVWSELRPPGDETIMTNILDKIAETFGIPRDRITIQRETWKDCPNPKPKT